MLPAEKQPGCLRGTRAVPTPQPWWSPEPGRTVSVSLPGRPPCARAEVTHTLGVGTGFLGQCPPSSLIWDEGHQPVPPSALPFLVRLQTDPASHRASGPACDHVPRLLTQSTTDRGPRRTGATPHREGIRGRGTAGRGSPLQPLRRPGTLGLPRLPLPVRTPVIDSRAPLTRWTPPSPDPTCRGPESQQGPIPRCQA